MHLVLRSHSKEGIQEIVCGLGRGQHRGLEGNGARRHHHLRHTLDHASYAKLLGRLVMHLRGVRARWGWGEGWDFPFLARESG